jgi:Uma2 family endonuclease
VSISTELVTAEQLAASPYADRSCELVDGRVVDVSPASWRHGWVAGRVHSALLLWAQANHTGVVVAAETGFVLRRNPDTVRAPDIAFVRAGRTVQANPFAEGAPDVAVEVLSPGARAGATARKGRDYLEAGAAQVWIAETATPCRATCCRGSRCRSARCSWSERCPRRTCIQRSKSASWSRAVLPLPPRTHRRTGPPR